MKKFKVFVAAWTSTFVFAGLLLAQAPPLSEMPSAEEMEEAQKVILNRMKSMYEKAFTKGNKGDDESLTEDEMVDVAFEFAKAQNEAMAGGAGGTIPEPSEEQLNRMKESLKTRIKAQFPNVDTDKDGAVSKAELFKSMFGMEYTALEEGEDDSNTDRDEKSPSTEENDESTSKTD